MSERLKTLNLVNSEYHWQLFYTTRHDARVVDSEGKPVTGSLPQGNAMHLMVAHNEIVNRLLRKGHGNV